MKKIIFIFLVFCLAITTVLAQITPDGTTTTTTDTVGGVTVIDIAAPDSNGLSNNTYTDFNISSSGVVFNNSDSAGDSQLASSISANSNYTSGNSASLILHQATGSNISSLLGKAEVFGTEAAVIIANPNGLACDGCGFINASKVDLITGASNFSGDDLIDFSIAFFARFDIRGNGFLDDAVVDELNLVSHITEISAPVKANNTLRILASNETYNHITNTPIVSTIYHIYDYTIFLLLNGNIEANSIELISPVLTNGNPADFGIASRVDISADKLKIDFHGAFSQYGSIHANTLTIIKEVDDEVLIYEPISSDTFNLITDVFDSRLLDKFTFNNLGITVEDLVLDDFNLNVPGSLTITVVGGEFKNHTSINAGNIDIVANSFKNYDDATITTNNLHITTGSFFNTSVGGDGNISTDIFNLSVAGDFDYTNSGTINANSFNLNVDGDFSNNDIANDFTWGENNNLTVLGNASITTNNYKQSGIVDIAGILTIAAENNFISQENAEINATALTITAGNSFNNKGDIVTNNLIITGYLAHNYGSIISDNLDITTDDYFRNLTGGDISVDTFNITAGGKVTNTATINAENLNIIANNDSSRTNDTTGFYVANRGDIQATNISIVAKDNFYNRGDITADTFTIIAKNIFFLNTDNTEAYDGGDVYLTGDSSFTATGTKIVNSGNIDSGNNNLDITAKKFINKKDAFINAGTLNLNVNTLNNKGSINATNINQ